MVDITTELTPTLVAITLAIIIIKSFFKLVNHIRKSECSSFCIKWTLENQKEQEEDPEIVIK